MYLFKEIWRKPISLHPGLATSRLSEVSSALALFGLVVQCVQFIGDRSLSPSCILPALVIVHSQLFVIP